ncbi:transcriptional repressor LexA [Clostridium sp. SYSU_GA19001]|uniref:transcriptional repressor LexA n=1 Tax=Clostridium caldaquaticum TaxID=2940653 RepID=UPI002076FA0C|nr:transcriptional repressor LexA [Clostridium caldaquaticum]MCM8711462.1 transcriptional repressor LexA [Clostridium caldaquaticum]
MQLDAVQNKIVRSRPLGISLLKGTSGSGKTTTAVYRALYLKNNYCLYNEDKILILAKDSINRDDIREKYNKIEDETKVDYKTLFSNNIDRVDVFTIGDIINRFYFEYTNSTKQWFKILQEDKEKNEIIAECTKFLKRKYGVSKILDNKYLDFLREEISWIKACGYDKIEDYQIADRIGRKAKKDFGPARFLKNSKEREIIFELLESYNHKLQSSSLIDYEDICSLALKRVQSAMGNKYTHILVDEAQVLTKTQIDFIKKLLISKTYSSITFIINKTEKVNSNSWFIKGRKLCNLDLGNKVKNYILSKTYIDKAEKKIIDMGKQKEINISMENFQYIDLKYHRTYDFKRDYNTIDEIFIVEGDKEESLKGDALKAVPVYSDIAAGEPIMINDEMESEFYLPQYWFKGIKDCFILKVKGDSMIGADIFDGDYVVIRKQSTAQKGDIVAVDLEGNATLKRLSYQNTNVVLMPENDKYEPIFIHDKQASVLGIAVGIIKNR